MELITCSSIEGGWEEAEVSVIASGSEVEIEVSVEGASFRLAAELEVEIVSGRDVVADSKMGEEGREGGKGMEAGSTIGSWASSGLEDMVDRETRQERCGMGWDGIGRIVEKWQETERN